MLELYRSRQERRARALEFGGNTPDLPGAYVNPTLLSGVNNDMTIAREEIFGPVAAAIEVDGVAEALERRQRFDLRPGRLRLDAGLEHGA